MNNALLQKNHNEMQKAVNQLKTGFLGEALVNFNDLANQTPVNRFTVSAKQMAGVTLRYMGQYEPSVTYLRTARELSEDSKDTLLKATILRDLGLSLYGLALCDGRDRPLVMEAFNYFCDSEELLEKAMKAAPQSDEYAELIDAELCATASCTALLRLESGDAERARSDLEFLHTRLAYLGSDFETYQFSNLVLLMRASGVIRRLRLFRLGTELAKNAPQPQRALQQVRAALFGNSVYRLVIKDGRWK